MPTYQYVCTSCDQPLEVVQGFNDDRLTECPACEGRLRQVFSAVGVVFKGSGFYRNDSRGAKGGREGGAAAASSAASSDSKSESKSKADASSAGTGGSSSTESSASSSTPATPPAASSTPAAQSGNGGKVA